MKRNSLSTTLKDYMTQSNNTTVTSSSSSKSPIIIKESPSSSSYANKNQMVKELWDCHANSSHSGEEYMNGFPWPPRSYTCSFCRKEFKSAQALGGHMNVHRRDRARLRQSPPISTADHHHGQGPMLNLNLNPTTTNPSFSTSPLSLLPSSSSSTSCASHKPVTSTLPLFVSAPPPPPPPAASPAELKRWFVMDGILVSPVSTKASSEPTKPKIADQSLSAVGGYDAFTREDGCKILKKAEILRMDLEIGLPRNYDLDLELRLGTYS